MLCLSLNIIPHGVSFPHFPSVSVQFLLSQKLLLVLGLFSLLWMELSLSLADLQRYLSVPLCVYHCLVCIVIILVPILSLF